MTSEVVLPLCQIGYSAKDLLRTHHWYRRALGYLAAGQIRKLGGEGPADVPDLPESICRLWCLVDQQPFFQIEMFEFERPCIREMPPDWRPSDIGFSMIGIHVEDFDEAVDRIQRTSGRFLSPAIGARGNRRICLRDPDGVLLELMEDDPLPSSPKAAGRGSPVRTRSITLSVADLVRATRFWADTLGFDTANDLHRPEHEALWGLEGAAPQRRTLRAGEFLVELAQYDARQARARPAGYLISDQGILNVAVGTTDRAAFDATLERVLRAGYKANSKPLTVPEVATVVYVKDDQGFAVELMHVEPASLERMGFLPNRDVY